MLIVSVLFIILGMLAAGGALRCSLSFDCVLRLLILLVVGCCGSCLIFWFVAWFKVSVFVWLFCGFAGLVGCWIGTCMFVFRPA